MSTSRQLRAIRGAISVERNHAQAIVDATEQLLAEMLERNKVEPEDVVSIIFTATPDLTAEFPAPAARRLGLSDVPLLCAAEIAVPGALPRCVRVLLHASSEKGRAQLRHVYLGEARRLRADLTGDEGQGDVKGHSNPPGEL
ncbi:MAG: chorismate mutase [Actinomycetota bacterium]|nr:chorismate mutase [Actinomycetota bacterium]